MPSKNTLDIYSDEGRTAVYSIDDLVRNGLPQGPCVITGLADKWSAYRRWTREFFENKYGDIELTVSRSRSHVKKNISLREYLGYMYSEQEDDPYYLKDWFFTEEYPEFIKDYELPRFFECWSEQLPDSLKLNLRWFYIGPANSMSSLHVDGMHTSAWNAVISGRKRWLFYPPDQAPYMYEGKVNAFAPLQDSYPLFEKATPVVMVQHPGEVVYTPSRWWHQVLNEAPTVSVTGNFVNETNYRLVGEYFKKKNLGGELKILEQMIEKNLGAAYIDQL